MTTIEISQTGGFCAIPSSWDELSPKQVQHIVKLYDKTLRGGKSLLEFNVRVLYYLMGMKYDSRSIRWERLASKEAIDERNSNIYLLCDKCLAFLLKEVGEKDVILSYDSIINSLPSVRANIFCRRLYGPADGLQDLSFGEFRHAATALNTYFKTQNEDDLNECIAHLYRVRSKHPNRAGRYIEEVNNGNIGVACRRVARLAHWQKVLIMLWFASCINFLQNGTVSLDGEEIDMSKLFTGGTSEDNVLSCGWQDLAIEIAKEGTVGNMDNVDAEPLYSIIGIMWHNHKENKRNEKASKSH